MEAKRRKRHLVWILTLAIFPLTAIAQHTEETPSCKQFAQNFYSWYVPLTQKETNIPAFAVALQHRPAVFDPLLLRALKADFQAQQQAKGELVGIDFDPFVGSQDPTDRYDLRNIRVSGDRCSVEVWRNSPNDTSQKSEKPDAVAKLSRRSGRWFFEDFQYPDMNAALMQVLDTLRKERQSKR